MYESSDIVRYLFSQYGDGSVPLMLGLGPLTDISSIISGLSRGTAGSRVTPSHEPHGPLELASYEASPFSRLVREALCTLEIPYLLRNVARGSPSRASFTERSGKMMVPWLRDPNTGTEMFESQDIVNYLFDQYAT